MINWNPDQIPEGISPEEANKVIENIAKSKANKYGRIAYLVVDDIYQEIRIKLWMSLEKFDPSKKVKLKTFLNVVAENRVKDIKRSLLYKHNKPCFRCPFWNKAAAQEGEHDCEAFEDKMECDKFAKHERFIHAKISANNPLSLDDTRIEEDSQYMSESTIDMLDHVFEHLPSGLHPLFTKLQLSNYDLSALKLKERDAIMGALKEILEGYEL